MPFNKKDSDLASLSIPNTLAALHVDPDVAKGAASVVLTEPGLTNIVALVEQGRTICQRILTWIINIISRVILKAALAADALVGTVLTLVGLPGLLPLPWWQMLAISIYAMVSCLVVNDAVKVAMIKWLVPIAAA
jgi:magnesium-transporting ATPase (P-type)